MNEEEAEILKYLIKKEKTKLEFPKPDFLKSMIFTKKIKNKLN